MPISKPIEPSTTPMMAGVFGSFRVPMIEKISPGREKMQMNRPRQDSTSPMTPALLPSACSEMWVAGFVHRACLFLS